MINKISFVSLLFSLSLLLGCTVGSENSDLAAGLKPVDCGGKVSTQEGPVLGHAARSQRTCAYLGIPFAAAPVGNLRFAAPQTPPKRDGTFNALSFGSQCLQKTGVKQQGVDVDLYTVGQEDCLFLNIWRPEGKKLPVMVFIHGGAFVVGAGSWTMYEGDSLAQENVIVVTLNYRLGPLGFFAYPGLITEGGSTGNQGILDQIQALKWVQANIGAFGGDTGNVTIFGESAGGMSVCTLLASPMAKSLFHAAIIESGGCKAVAPLSLGYAHAASYAVDTACNTATDPLACMRAMTEADLMKAFDFDIVLSALEPHVDGFVLTQDPLTMIRAGNLNSVPVMAGSNANEFKIVAVTNPHNQSLKTAPWSDYYAGLRATFGEEVGTRLSDLYGAEKYPTPFDAWFMLKTDYILACPTFLGAQSIAAQGSKAYHYIFDWSDLGSVGELTGTVHGLELFFVFGTLSTLQLVIPNDKLESAALLSKRVRGAWASFARDHKPAAAGFPAWPEVGKGSMVLSTNPHVDVKIKRDECAYWDDKLPIGLEVQAGDLNSLVDNYSF